MEEAHKVREKGKEQAKTGRGGEGEKVFLKREAKLRNKTICGGNLKMCPRGLTASLSEERKEGWDQARALHLCSHPAPAFFPLTSQGQELLSVSLPEGPI